MPREESQENNEQTYGVGQPQQSRGLSAPLKQPLKSFTEIVSPAIMRTGNQIDTAPGPPKFTSPGLEIYREGPRWIINWKTTHVPLQDFQSVARWVAKSPSKYHSATPEVTAGVAKWARANAKSMSADQVLSAKDILTKWHIMRTRLSQKAAGAAAARYRAGSDIVRLSVDFDQPPVMLLKLVLVELGTDPSVLETAFLPERSQAVAAARAKLSTRDREQLLAAEAIDAQTWFNQKIMADIAAENENAFVEFLRERGIALRDQASLVDEQLGKYGRAIATPDVLFVDEVVLNGKPCMWLEYKDYIGTTTPFLANSNIKQIQRYNMHFGPGAICFHRGCVEDFAATIPAAVLDAGILPITLKK